MAKININIGGFATALPKQEGQPTKLLVNRAQMELARRMLEENDMLSDISRPAPWDSEPNYVMLEHAGYVCELKRAPSTQSWCGYVHVGEDHPLLKWVERDNHYDFLDVHGGVTYAEGGQIGFECSHSTDVSPSFGYGMEEHATYKTVDFATEEVKKLAQQLRNYDNAYTRSTFMRANELESRAQQLRRSLHKKEVK